MFLPFATVPRFLDDNRFARSITIAADLTPPIFNFPCLPDLLLVFLGLEDGKKLSDALIKAIRTEKRIVHYLLLLAFTSGMRFAEIIALTRSDFDFKNNSINVSKSWGYSPNFEEGFRDTKTESSVRLIKMDKRTMGIFKDLFENTPDNIHRLVFYNPASKYKVYSNTGVNKALKKLLETLKIDSISIHGLRHTHASILLYEGISIQYISERLGHADVDTTIRIYAHMIKELKQKDEQKTAELFAAI